jgi:hypothetical protein
VPLSFLMADALWGDRKWRNLTLIS